MQPLASPSGIITSLAREVHYTFKNKIKQNEKKGEEE
jgi:hypothetical protein